MARSMILIGAGLLSKLYSEHKIGVPISKLIQKYDLTITPPTLTKLISYYDAMHTTTDLKLRATIHASLFPDWLALDEIASTTRRTYTGKMPLGSWVDDSV